MPLSSDHTSAALSAGDQPRCVRPGFDLFDDVVRLRDARGVLAVRIARPEDGIAIAGHVERRALSVDRASIRGSQGPVESGWRDVARRLGVVPVPSDPVDAARAIVSRAAARRAALIVPMFNFAPWDAALSVAACELPSEALIVLIVPRDARIDLGRTPWFEVESRLDDAGLSRFWDAFAAVQRRVPGGELAALEGWLIAARRAKVTEPDLSGSARRLLRRLALAERAWPAHSLAALGDDLSLASLINAGLVESRDGLLTLADHAAPTEGQDPHELAYVAEALSTTFHAEAWARARASELLAAAGQFAEAEHSMRTALENAGDISIRADLWRRWRALALLLPDAARTAAQIRAAELALELGDVDASLEWAESAAAGGGGAKAAYVLGCGSLARGDLVSAEAALKRARELSGEAALKLQALVDLAEVRYASGDLEGAERLACDVLSAEAEPRVRLSASNLLGKLLLARAEWDLADAHFAADACEAAFTGDYEGELRARVNRAIALLSRGSSEEARPILLDVLQRAEDHGEHRAIGFALSNLAVLAIDRHEYGEALERSERAIVVRRRLGDRLGFARDITNLVELRLRLGLTDQAEQALRFGRQALGPGAPASRLAELALAAARVHLNKSRTLEAEREVRVALRTAAQASDGDKLGECHRLAARIALEDGVVARSEAEIARARALAGSPYARGEVALLEALAARAAGRPSAELVASAVIAARESGDEELAREAHVLAAEIAIGENDPRLAAEHVSLALALRDDVARSIRAETRDAYLARRDMLRLSRLERLVDERGEEDEPVSLRPSVPPKAAEPSPVFVGRHPTVRALLESVRRIGRTGATVLIHGESGSGKELIAELLHSASDRASGPLVKVNCAALVESLLLSELFGHEKGAFTGATARKRGRFERANGGTLFLDEIGDISPRTQVALLRVLEERTIERVGGTAAIPVDVRIVCATNRELRSMVERGQFREDLYYRLSGIALEVPPLRERPADLLLLCEALLTRIAGERGESKKTVSQDALELLARHRWPGNVRELENALRAASLFAAENEIQVGELIEHVEALRKLSAEPAPLSTSALSRVEVTTRAPSNVPSVGRAVSLEAMGPSSADVPVTGAAYREIRDAGVSLSDLKRRIERECIARALSETGGNITRAAAVLGMKRPRLSQLVKHYGLLSTEDADESAVSEEEAAS